MKKPGWYVIQVETGRERALCEVIARVCTEADQLAEQRWWGAQDGGEAPGEAPAPLLDECFSPRYRTRRKREGEWRDEERLLLPGYVVAVTRRPEALAHCLRGVRDFTRLLTMGETFVPLRDDERAWIEEWTTKGDRTVPLSVAYKQGDVLVVTEGPLKGHEGKIVRVNRRKCLAFVELHVGGKRVTTTVGLAVVPSD